MTLLLSSEMGTVMVDPRDRGEAHCEPLAPWGSRSNPEMSACVSQPVRELRSSPSSSGTSRGVYRPVGVGRRPEYPSDGAPLRTGGANAKTSPASDSSSSSALATDSLSLMIDCTSTGTSSTIDARCGTLSRRRRAVRGRTPLALPVCRWKRSSSPIARHDGRRQSGPTGADDYRHNQKDPRSGAPDQAAQAPTCSLHASCATIE